MKTVISALVFAMFASTATLAFAASQKTYEPWTDPGRAPAVSQQRGVIMKMASFPNDVREELARLEERSRITTERFEKALESDAAIAPAEKTRLKNALWVETLVIKAGALVREKRKRSTLTIERMQEIGVPEPLFSTLAAEIDQTAYAVGKIENGQECDYMPFGDGLMKRHVRLEVSNDKLERIPAVHRLDGGLKAHIFRITRGEVGFEARKPTICDNTCAWEYSVSLTLMGPRPTSSASDAWIADSPEPGGCVQEFVIHLWDSKTLPSDPSVLPRMESNVNFSQSRDHGAKYRFAAENGLLQHLPGGPHEFRLAFRESRAEKLRDKTYLVNGMVRRFPGNLGNLFGSDSVAVPVRDGIGKLSITVKPENPDGWLKADAAVWIRSAWASLPYPESGQLLSCSPWTIPSAIPANSPARTCGREWRDPEWELVKLIKKVRCQQPTHWHFVK